MALGLRAGTPLALKAALRSLSALPKSELADPVEGGFFDRCESPKWTGPFTRKSLAVNAGLTQALSTAGAWTGDAPLIAAARRTAEFLETQMGAEDSELWVGALSPDEEYYAKMAHRRGQGERPAPEGLASPGDNARAISALVRAGMCLDEPRFVGRARIAARELFAGGAPSALGDIAAQATGAADLFMATGDRTFAVVGAELARLAAEPTPAARNAESARPLAEINLVLSRLLDQSERSDRGEWPQMDASLPAEGGPVGDVAAIGMADLVANTFGVDIDYWGPAPAAPQAGLVRSAVALAWALGMPALNRQQGPAAAAPRLRFRGPATTSRETSGAGDLRELLRIAIALHEAI